MQGIFVYFLYFCAMMFVDKDTICAVSTPAGVGGVAIVRISGPDAIGIADSVLSMSKPLAEKKANTVSFGKLLCKSKVESQKSKVESQKLIVDSPNNQITASPTEILDEVLVSIFRAPHSFTGEDVVEIAVHGSLYVQREAIKLLLAAGCRMADHGEFTKRAFMNGKMDLSQAEAVADVIASRSAAAHKVAVSQMRGGFSRKLQTLRAQLLQFTSLIELELDFSEEDVEFADRSQLKALSGEIESDLSKLMASFSTGNAVKNGVPVAIVGETNAGKSTLLNLLLGDDKAIVSDIHGTTRDIIEDTTDIGGMLFRFIDTAGIRETSDTIENLGIKRSYGAIEKAQIVLWMIDATGVSEHIDWMATRIVPRTEGKQLFLLFNKMDKISDDEREVLDGMFADMDARRFYISAKLDQGIDAVRDALVEASHMAEIDDNDVVVTNLRHYEALVKAHAAILKVQEGLAVGLSGEFLSMDLHDCLDALGSIVGQISSDEVLCEIFSKFCIGK
jgi:tRNA modification GTPase